MDPPHATAAAGPSATPARRAEAAEPATALIAGAREVTACRICGASDLAVFLDLGSTPLANAFVRPEDAHREEARYPLAVARCGACGLVQLTVVVDPRVLFSRYVYSSSASAPMRAHFDGLAERIVPRYAPAGSLVVEIGSNDGILLRGLAARGARVLGVEPAANIAALANADGLETWIELFDEGVARRIADERGRAAVLVGNNVLAHIAELPMVVRAADELLAPDGVIIAEVPYLGALIEHVEYDTIYHEHLSYFHLRPLSVLLSAGGFELFDIARLDTHGGSIRIFAARAGTRSPTARLGEALSEERASALDDPATYASFARRVSASRGALRDLLARLRREGAQIIGWGATAKGNTLLNYCGIGAETLEYIADSTPFKHGLLAPGSRIPVRPESAVHETRPDHALLLAWNYADVIMTNNAAFRAQGGRFIHPISARFIG